MAFTSGSRRSAVEPLYTVSRKHDLCVVVGVVQPRDFAALNVVVQDASQRLVEGQALLSRAIERRC